MHGWIENTGRGDGKLLVLGAYRKDSFRGTSRPRGITSHAAVHLRVPGRNSSNVNFPNGKTQPFEPELFNSYGEFDPGSGRTLAARLTHASRTVFWFSDQGAVADGCVTRERPAEVWGTTGGNAG